MKTLIVIRHAKAEESHGEADSKRKLTERGLHDAELVAKKLLDKGYKIDKIFSSPAVRTKETTAILAKVHHVAEEDIRYFDSLYLGDTLQITEAVNWLQKNIDTLAVVGHNPGVTNFTNDVTGADIGSLPTTGVAIIKTNATGWQEFNEAQKTLAEVLSPRE